MTTWLLDESVEALRNVWFLKVIPAATFVLS